MNVFAFSQNAAILTGADMAFVSASLSVNDLACSAGGFPLLSGIAFQLNPGQALLIRGPNGAGKTTLLRVLAGLARPDAGECMITREAEGADCVWEDNTALHFLGHANALKTALTLKQNLTFWAAFNGGGRDGAEARSRHVANTLNLGPLLHLPVSVLSAGQKRRAAFARLLLSARPIWLLDEPTAALDADVSVQIEALCHAHQNKGGIVIAATHLPFLEEGRDTRTLDLAEHHAAGKQFANA